MSFLRWDVLAIAFVLAIPLLFMGYRGELELDQVATRLPWCLLAGWGAMTVLRWAAQTPPQPSAKPDAPDPGATEPDGAGSSPTS